LQFRYRGSRRESAVAQLFSLGHFTPHTFMNDEKIKLLAQLAISSDEKIMRLAVLMHKYVEIFSASLPADFPKGALLSQIEQLEAVCHGSAEIHAALRKEFGL
jgi:hypothetical protein